MDTTAARLLSAARSAAQLTQRELARRARPSQSVVARVESGEASPSWRTLRKLLHGAGFDLQTTLVPLPARRSHMLDDVARILRLTPEQRLQELRNAARFFHAAKLIGTDGHI